MRIMKHTRSFDTALLHTVVCGFLFSAAHAFAEWIPPITMGDLLRSNVITVGRFSQTEGKTDFLVSRVIKGDAAAARKRMLALLKDTRDTVQASGGLRLQSYRGSYGRMEGTPGDLEKLGVWFLLGDTGTNGVTRQSAELADGFADLVDGRSPGALFSLLQKVDLDRQRDALEELHAKRDSKLVAQLHEVALAGDSELSAESFQVLTQTKLVEPDRFWGRWTSLPIANGAADMLSRLDADRTMTELKAALSTEANPQRIVSLLYAVPYQSGQKFDLALPFLGHPSSAVRDRAIGNIWDALWDLNAKSYTSTEAKAKLSALGERIIPMIDERLKVETDPGCKNRLTSMLERKDGIPWILRIPRDRLIEPIPPYSEEKELQFLVSRLTSHSDHGFIMETSGREIAERFFDEGFKMLKSAAAATEIYNPENVYDGMGYVRHPQMFDYLVDHLSKIGPGDRTYKSTFRALGVQNNPGSLTAIKRYSKQINEHNDAKLDGVAQLNDKGVLPYLMEHRAEIKYHVQIPYLRACAMHGDAWAAGELLAALQEPPASKFLTDGYWTRSDIVEALIYLDTPAATEALKREVEKAWPAKSASDGFSSYWARLDNHAGSSRRSSAIAEVARRDPQWLAALALKKMRDHSLPARSYGASVFRQLTGQMRGFQPEAFASERAKPMRELEDWWAVHQSESREQWIVRYFTERGFKIEKLDKSALPDLVRALESDFFTYNLAVEQVSAICRKYFGDFQHQDSMYQGQERMTVRVTGWLRATKWIE